MKRTTAAIGSLLVSAVLLAPVAHAQLASAPVDEARLTQLYQAYLDKGKSDAYLEKRIAEETAKIRKQIDDDLKQSLSAQSVDSVTDPAALPKALDRQRGVVASLQSSENEANVDLDLLQEEERKYYLNSAAGTGTSLDDLRITTSYAQLLAKKAILQQRVASLDAALSLQGDRLQKLEDQQRFQQFGSLFDVVWYVLIILAAVLIDRLVKRELLPRITRGKRRYFVSKILTGVIYGVALLWLTARLLDQHPGAFASLAIIGAGIAVALQGVVKDVVGWLIIVQRRYYAPGDRISTGTFTGDVVDVGPFRTAMLEISPVPERNGKMLYLPNSLVMSQDLLNYHATSEFVAAELKVTVTHDSDWRRAEAILKELLMEEVDDFTKQAAEQQRRRTALLYLSRKVGGPEVHLDAVENGYQFTLGFTVPIGFRRDVVTRMWHKLLECFEDAGIRVAFNTLKVVKGDDAR